MKRRFLFLVLLLVVLAGLLWRFALDRPQEPIVKMARPRPVVQQKVESKKPTPKEEEYSFQKVAQIANAGDREGAWRKGYSAPIDFWGRVVDEATNGIAGATIVFSVDDNPDPYASCKEFNGVSDNEGYFSIEGKKGAALAVDVGKKGWRVIKKPQGFLAFWARGSPGYNLPSKENPVLIVMRKKGEAAELVRINDKSFKVGKDGAPVDVDLKTGKVAASGQGDFRVECWTDDQNKDEKKHYDWRCRVSVPGGGLAPWKGEEGFEFEAPTEGYKESDEINMSKTAKRWLDQAERKYFVKTVEGKYARIAFHMYAFGGHSFVVKGYYNPSGSRNLEYDPAKQIKP